MTVMLPMSFKNQIGLLRVAVFFLYRQCKLPCAHSDAEGNCKLTFPLFSSSDIDVFSFSFKSVVASRSAPSDLRSKDNAEKSSAVIRMKSFALLFNTMSLFQMIRNGWLYYSQQPETNGSCERMPIYPYSNFLVVEKIN